MTTSELLPWSRAQSDLQFALQEQDIDSALVAIENLRRELLQQHYQGRCAEESKEEQDEVIEVDRKEENKNLARLVPIASLRKGERVPSTVRRSFVSDITCLRTVYEMVLQGEESDDMAIAIHNVDGTLVLTGVNEMAERWGELDPETGEIIVHCEEAKRLKSHKSNVVDATPNETLWDQFLRQSRYRALESSSDSLAKRPDSPKYRRLVEYSLNDDIDLVVGSDSLIYAAEDRFLAAHAVGQSVTREEAVNIWLENRINHADNCAVCYHREGSVSGYQLLRTDDLPNCFFDTSTEVANYCWQQDTTSVFHFLNKHCISENGTYCLRKRGDSLDLWQVEDYSSLVSSSSLSQTKHKKKSKQKHNKETKLSPFATVVAGLCLRIASCTNDASYDLRRRLLERCVLLDTDNAEARLALADILVQPVEHYEEAVLDAFQDALSSEAYWLVAAPAHLDKSQVWPVQSLNLTATNLVEKAHAQALHHILMAKNKAHIKEIEKAHSRSRLVLAAAAYQKHRPGAALWHMSQLGGTVLLKEHRPRLALIMTQMSRLIQTEDDCASHKADCAGIISSALSHDPSLRKEKIVLEVTNDVEANLNRAIKLLLGGSVAKHNGLLRALYTRLGEHYLAVDRITKAGRHLGQGVELFRGLGDLRTEMWLRFKKSEIQLRVLLDRGSAPSTSITHAFFALNTAAQELRASLEDTSITSSTRIPASACSPLLDADEAANLADATVARFGLRLNPTLQILSIACAAADKSTDDDLKADTHYKLGSHLVRSAGNPGDVLHHFSRALAAREKQLLCHSDNTTIALDAIAIAVDQLRVLVDTKPEIQTNMVACLAARSSLRVLATSGNIPPDAFKANLVLRSFLARLNDTFKAALLHTRDKDGTQTSSEVSATFQSQLKAAYSTALRLQGRLHAGDSSLCHRTTAAQLVALLDSLDHESS